MTIPRWCREMRINNGNIINRILWHYALSRCMGYGAVISVWNVIKWLWGGYVEVKGRNDDAVDS